MQERTTTSVGIYIGDSDDAATIDLPPMTDRERLRLKEKIEAYGKSCLSRREKEAKRRLDKAKKLESEAAALRGESA